MKAGMMRHKITIQEIITTDNRRGGQIEYWVDKYSDIWASYEPLTARETIIADSQQSKIQGKVRIRYREGIHEKMRIIFKGKILKIQGKPINPEGRNRELICLVSESGELEDDPKQV